MAALLNDDLLEHILIRSDVEDLIRYKSVCKQWYSLIKSSGFISRHKDRCNNEHGDKRIILHDSGRKADGYGLVGSSNGLVCVSSPYGNEVLVGNPITREVRKVKPPLYLSSFPLSRLPWNFGFGYDSSRDDYRGGGRDYSLVGSSNGLVCVSCPYGSEVFVGNPITREVRKVKTPCWSYQFGWLPCGFGYDSSRDEYKVFFATWKVYYQVFSSKSNTWSEIRKLNYNFITRVGILCNGALHWVVRDDKNERLIMSYDLSSDKFKEIRLPGDVRCQWLQDNCYQLGNYKGCLCLCTHLYSIPSNIWVMNKYGVTESWELQQPGQHSTVTKYDITIYVKRTPHENGRGIFQTDTILITGGVKESTSIMSEYVCDPVYVQSLVSPHVNV